LAKASTNRLAPIYSIGLVLLALVALIYVASALPVDSLSDLRLRDLSWWFFLAITFLHIAYLLLSAEVWRRMLRMLTHTSTAYLDAYMQMAAVAVGKYIPGKFWGFIARTGQLHRHNVSARQSLMSSVVEQLLVLAGGGIVIIGAGLLALPEYTGSLVLLGSILLLGLLVMSVKAPTVVRWLQRKKTDSDVAEDLSSFSPFRFLQYAAAYAVLWLISGLVLCIIYFSLFDAVATVENIAALVFANTIGFVVGFLAVFAPGGLGVREATTVAVLAPFFPIREMIVATIVLRAWIVLFDGINAVILLFGESRRTAKDLT